MAEGSSPGAGARHPHAALYDPELYSCSIFLRAVTSSPAATAFVTCLTIAVALWRPRVLHDKEAEVFLDHFPCLRHHTAFWASQRFGPRQQRWPALLERFDWYLYDEVPGSIRDHHGPSWRHLKDPRVVVASPSSWHMLQALGEEELDANRSDRVLVFAGMPERFLSETLSEDPAALKQQVLQLQKYFPRILHEYKDVEAEGVLTLPSGVNELYLRPSVLRCAWAAIAAARLDADAKPRGVLTVPTIYWQATATNVTSRVEAREWAASPAGHEAGVEMRYVDPREWYGELATYRFLLSPTGTGIQNAKTIEALLVLTLPIVQRCVAHDDMVRLGFPLVVVDRWQEVTRTALSAWWLSLAPRLVSFRHNCLTTEAYWRLIVGEVNSCE